MNEDTKEFIQDIVSTIVRNFGITGCVPEAGSIQPGAMEVISDALGNNNFGDGPGIAGGLHEISLSIDDLAAAIREAAEMLSEKK